MVAADVPRRRCKRSAQGPIRQCRVSEGPCQTVFASSAAKVVFLISFQGDEAHARASGVILSPDGYIGTNYHALQGADTLEIRYFADPTNSDDYQVFGAAKLLYADAERDIAILKVNTTALPFFDCPTRTACVARIGETVYAIGNPKGFNNTISEGIVSGRRVAGGEDLIQHTAAISHGSSGGALVDANGGLLGINTWAIAEEQNLNFAISAKYLWEALEVARHATTALKFPPEAPTEARQHRSGNAPDSPSSRSRKKKRRAVSQMREIADGIRQSAQGPLARFQAPELRRALKPLSRYDTDFRVYEPSPSGTCPDKVARSFGSPGSGIKGSSNRRAWWPLLLPPG